MKMLPNKSVRKTLLESLFSKPNPIKRREYERAHTHVFPGVEPFVRFLRADSYQEMVEHAKTAITRLVYHHHLPPPTRLLFNLLDFEEKESVYSGEGDYVPQDHFVHLIHLYLLGVYFFAYHKTLHRECATEFNRVKRSWARQQGATDGRGKFGSYQTFATAWAMFVLYHDLGYPVERGDRGGARGKWLAPFSRLRKSVLKDLALKSLANLVSLSAFIRERSGISLGEMYLDHCDQYFVASNGRWKFFFREAREHKVSEELSFEESESYREVLLKWRDAALVRGVGGVSSLRVLGTLLPDEAVCAVLENSETGEPVVFLQKKSDDRAGVWLQDPRLITLALRQARKRLWEMAFWEGKAPGEEYLWRYFILRASEYFDQNLELLLGEKAESFLAIVNELEGDPDFKTAKLIQSDSAAELAYTAYRLMNRSLGYIAEEEEHSDLEQFFESYERGFSSMRNSLPGLMAACVQGILKDGIGKGEIDPGEILRTQERPKAVAELVSYLLGQRPELELRLGREIGPALRKSAELEKVIRDCSREVRSRMSSGVAVPKELFDEEVFTSPSKLSGVLESLRERGDLENSIKRLGLGGLGDLIAGYRHPATVTEERILDHGLASAVVLLGVLEMYEACLKDLRSTDLAEAPVDVKLLRLAFRTTAPSDEAWIGVEFKYIASDVALAVALHNLYPSAFPEERQKAYRTRLTSHPFAFLALLADGLQKWDRKRLYNPAEKDVGGIVPGSRFDLKIQGDLIYVYLRTHRMDIPAEEQRLRSGLRDYLAGADTLIRLQLLES